MAETKAPLTLYVESRKAVTSFYRPPQTDPSGSGAMGTTRMGSASTGAGEASDVQNFLSDDQARAMALTEEIAHKRGFPLEVKDVAKSGRLERIVTEHLRNVTTFPVLITQDGRRLEGASNFTEDRLCELMPTEMPSQRAFTYLKIRGGDFDALRRNLLGFPEVRELHFLTGDWDAFVVLEFNTGLASKREILDFVTQRIRSMNDVIDTSTLVPEVSITKFAV